MRYNSVAQMAKRWNISERSVRNYCASGRIEGAVLIGKTWNIPEDATKPERLNKSKKDKNILLDLLQDEKASKYKGGIYHSAGIEYLLGQKLKIIHPRQKHDYLFQNFKRANSAVLLN